MQDRDEFTEGPEGLDNTEPDADPAARETFEAAQLSRRAALKKMGLTAGVTAGLFFSDSFLRVVAGKLNQHETDEAYADSLSHGLREAGALAVQPAALELPAAHRKAIRATSTVPGSSVTPPLGSLTASRYVVFNNVQPAYSLFASGPTWLTGTNQISNVHIEVRPYMGTRIPSGHLTVYIAGKSGALVAQVDQPLDVHGNVDIAAFRFGTFTTGTTYRMTFHYWGDGTYYDNAVASGNNPRYFGVGATSPGPYASRGTSPNMRRWA